MWLGFFPLFCPTWQPFRGHGLRDPLRVRVRAGEYVDPAESVVPAPEAAAGQAHQVRLQEAQGGVPPQVPGGTAAQAIAGGLF